MRSIVSSSLICLCLSGVTAMAAAQQAGPELPQPSPKARVEQRVGLTDISVEYSSPAVKARKIWGALVAYDKPWRTGANAATKLTVSRPFMFGGKTVPAGSYALYTIPGQASWTVVLSSALEAWGDNGFDAKKDVARVSVKPQAAAARERLAFIFSNTTDEATQLDLEWEKLKVSIPIGTDTQTASAANIQKAVDDAWRPHYVAARYLLDKNTDLDKALGYIDQSIAIKSLWSNNWVRAQLLQKKGRAQDAVATAEKVMQLGNGDQTFEAFFKQDVAKSVSDWKKQH
jgi:hypothetical protein